MSSIDETVVEPTDTAVSLLKSEEALFYKYLTIFSSVNFLLLAATNAQFSVMRAEQSNDLTNPLPAVFTGLLLLFAYNNWQNYIEQYV